MTCPGCGSSDLVYWSDPGVGSFGNACLACKLFIQKQDGETYSRPLVEAFFPRNYRGVPKYRTAVDWRGP